MSRRKNPITLCYAKCEDQRNPDNDCLAQFPSLESRDAWCEKHTDEYVKKRIWTPITVEDAAIEGYDIRRFYSSEYGRRARELGYGSDNRMVFAIEKDREYD